ncbi:MAG: RNA polymerase sigma factor (sigma-70 family) [Verrucomicrobiales bacterium]|jgi:RNA polymerase sigma factor (sigma-70 family)
MVKMVNPVPDSPNSLPPAQVDDLCRIALTRMQALWPFACRLGESLSKFEDVDDLWQDVTLKIWRKIADGSLDAKLVDSPQFSAYVRRALLRRFLEIVRHHSAQKRDYRCEVTIEELHDVIPSAQPLVAAQFEALHRALNQLPAEWNTVIRGKYLEGRTLKEAGEEAGLSPSAISKGLASRMAQLRAILLRYENESPW